MTAICVELALCGVEADIERELKTSSGQTTEALRRLLVLLKERQKCIADLAAGEVTVQQMIDRHAA